MKENILVIKHGALGDFVMQSGCMRTIRTRHPGAHIAIITEGFLRGLAEAMGFFDEVIVDSRGYNPSTWWRVIVKEIGGRKWDAIYDLQSSNRTLCRYYPLVLTATRHAMKWGHLVKGGLMWRTSSRKIPFFPWGYKNVFETIGWEPNDLSNCHGERQHFDLLPERYALLIPGCSVGNTQKRWPPERFRELTRFLAGKGLKSVVMGTKAEAKEIGAICENNENAIDFMGKSSIADIPDLARGAALVAGNDTGPAHIAHIAGAKTVMLFTDYDYGRAAPKGKANVIALHGAKIADIPVAAVVDSLEELCSRSTLSS